MPMIRPTHTTRQATAQRQSSKDQTSRTTGTQKYLYKDDIQKFHLE